MPDDPTDAEEAPGNVFTNPAWPPALGVARRDRDSLRAQVIALVSDENVAGQGS
jgi:hypothetical protein